MDVKGQLKDWLKKTGVDIAKAVGAHIKEKGVAYAKDQLGLGMDAEMHGKDLEMSGSGAGDWLKQTGVEIAKAVGAHLKDHFKTMAVKKAQDYLGEGITEGLKSVGKAVGQAALSHAIGKAGDIKDKKSAKAAAKSTGQAALSEGKKQFAALINKHFGGALDPEDAVRTCQYSLPELRKAITDFRRDLQGVSHDEYLDAHAHMLVKMAIVPNKTEAEKTREYKARLPGMSKRQKLRDRAIIKKRLHPAVSKMNRKRCVEYVYGTALELGIDWAKYLDKRTMKKKPSKRCETRFGQAGEKYRRVDHVKKAPTQYNEFMREKLKDKTFLPNTPYGGKHGRFARAAKLWKRHKAALDSKAAEKASATRSHDILQKIGPIPKKKKDIDQRIREGAQAAYEHFAAQGPSK
eukprot:COSAG05_NODE_2936_length_2487_cov_31.407035_2_plen_405_part_00